MQAPKSSQFLIQKFFQFELRISDSLKCVWNYFYFLSPNLRAPLMNSGLCGKANLVDVDINTVYDLIRNNCSRSLQFGSSKNLEFDLESLETEMKDRFVVGK